MTPFAFGLVKAVLWAMPLLFGYLAARARPGRARGGLLLTGALLALFVRPLFLGLGMLLLGYGLGLVPSGKARGASKGRSPGR